MGLQFNSAAVGVNSKVNEALLIVDTGQVAMDDGMVRAQTQGSQVSSHSSEITQVIIKTSALQQSMLHLYIKC